MLAARLGEQLGSGTVLDVADPRDVESLPPCREVGVVRTA
jgi:hypothetical protein